MLGLSEIVVDVSAFDVELVGEILEISADVLASLRRGIVVVEIPIETVGARWRAASSPSI